MHNAGDYDTIAVDNAYLVALRFAMKSSTSFTVISSLVGGPVSPIHNNDTHYKITADTLTGNLLHVADHSVGLLKSCSMTTGMSQHTSIILTISSYRPRYTSGRWFLNSTNAGSSPTPCSWAISFRALNNVKYTTST
jgi:hypothetical protein